MHRERREKFRLAARLDAKMKRRARRHDLLHDFLKLVHLDREHAAVHALVFEILDGRRERAIDRLHAVPQQIVKAQHHRESQPLLLRLGDGGHNFHGRLFIERREDLHVALVVDPEVTAAPPVHVVE